MGDASHKSLPWVEKVKRRMWAASKWEFLRMLWLCPRNIRLIHIRGTGQPRKLLHTQGHRILIWETKVFEKLREQELLRGLLYAPRIRMTCMLEPNIISGEGHSCEPGCAQKDARCLLSMPGPGTYMIPGVPVATPAYHVCYQS